MIHVGSSLEEDKGGALRAFQVWYPFQEAESGNILLQRFRFLLLTYTRTRKLKMQAFQRSFILN